METQRLDWCFYELFQICHWPRLLEPSVKMVGILLAYLQEVRISTSEDDGVVVGPFGGVAPGLLQRVPEVAPGRVAHDALREALPHQEGKVHLQTNMEK